MVQVLAVVVGVLYAGGVYLMLRRSVVKLLIGLSLLSHAANLLIFTSAGLTRGAAPLVPEGSLTPPSAVADPVAQALVLTSIVIGFGLLVFTTVLVHRAHEETGTDDLDEMRRRG